MNNEILSKYFNLIYENLNKFEFKLADKNKIYNYFLYYLLQGNKDLLFSYAQGSTIKEVRPNTLKKLPFVLPPLSEQKKIASILSSVDKKIKKEEEYKAKLERLKKGLMQKLLTGEIRVNTESEV